MLPALQTQQTSTFPKELAQVILDARYDSVLFTERLLGMPLHEGQKEFMRNSTAEINMLSSGNRWGKSSVIACKHLWKNFYKHGINPGNEVAWFRAEYRTANLAPHSKLVEPVFKAIKAIVTSSFPIPQPDGTLRNNECLIGWFCEPDKIRESMPMKIPFTNNSYVDFASTGEDRGGSVQGRPYGYISFDEGGRDHHLKYALDSNILSRLTDWQGQIDIPCTPDSVSPSLADHYDLFQRGMDPLDADVYSQEGSVDENVFLKPEAVKQLKERYKDSELYPQVVHGKFIFAGDTIFPMKDVMAARDENLNNGIGPIKEHKYVIGVDTAIGNDEMVFTVLDTTSRPFRLVRQMACKGKSKPPDIHMYDFIGLVEQYKTAGTNAVKICLETWSGESVRFYKDLPMNLQMITKTWGSFTPEGVIRPPKGSRAAKKADIIIALRKVLSSSDLKIPAEDKLVKQLNAYRMDDANISQDRVISLALAAWLATDGQPKMTNIELVEVEW